MKNLRKLVIASFMLVIAFVAVVSSTYAWFTQSSEGKVNDITIGVVDANKSLLISKDAANASDLVWSKSLSYDFEGDKYTPVTMSTASGVFQKFYELRTDDDLFAYYVDAAQLLEKPSGENATNTTETGYVKLDLVFQVQAADTVYGTKIYVDIINLHAFVKGTALNVANDANAEENEFAASSFRMAFVDKTAVVQQIIEGPNTTDANGHYNSGTQFVATNAWMQRYAQDGAEHNYHNGDTAITGIADGNKGLFVEQKSVGSVWTLKAAHEDAIYATGEGSKVKGYNNATFDSSSTSTVESEIAANAAKAEYVIENFYQEPACTTAVTSADTTGYAKITIYVWMEGWDGDCENVASGAIYRFGLQFQVK